MQVSKENKIAFTISFSILLLAFLVSELFHIFHLNYYFSFSGQGQNKYIIFIILAILSYFISYFLAKITIKPIKEANELLKSYNHNLAHEVKTPMAVIKSNLELLEM
jgi:signal transduction histidine kinase